MQFVLVSLTDEPYLDFDYPSFHVLGFLLYEIANAGFSFDFLPVLKHRDSGIGVVPVVRVSLTVASSRRGEMESYTVSARV